MCSYLLQLNHIQTLFRYWYPLSLSISDIAIDNALHYRYWWHYRYSVVTSTWPSSRNALVLSVSSALLFWRDYKSVKWSKTGERWLVGFVIRYKVTIKTDSFTKAVLERYKDKAKILESKGAEILGLFFLKESLIFQKCVKETSASERQNGTLILMHQSQRTWEDILKRVVL